MNRIIAKQKQRLKRKKSIRKNISGTPERPRLSVYRSNRYVYVQAIDDTNGVTLAAVNNLQADFKAVKSTVSDAGKLGEALGTKLKALNIETAVFDRNGFRYHGVIKALADGVRSAGIRF